MDTQPVQDPMGPSQYPSRPLNPTVGSIPNLENTLFIAEPNGNSISLRIRPDGTELVVQNGDGLELVAIQLTSEQVDELKPKQAGEEAAKTENEVKFAIDPATLPAAEILLAYATTPIEQGYIAIDPKTKSEARVRDRDGTITFTIKVGTGEIRGEREIEFFPEQNGSRLFGCCICNKDGQAVERVVKKTRTVIPYGDKGLKVELDIYSGDLAGLVTAEIEYGPDDSRPDGLRLWNVTAVDVTNDKGIKNQSLAVNGKPEIHWA